ncbi:hypothetical protein BJ322DRAFT_1040350 [Thelephora terrestris]|uniref:Uncharacterized protein n=1 Tax=Thelephora terrestris TaxID=56493 RepID=A0A9P6LAV6_9AGAM|nr:hypothetical protein BJ322DRAFT_1040350 [Thelephora terrestris]
MGHLPSSNPSSWMCPPLYPWRLLAFSVFFPFSRMFGFVVLLPPVTTPLDETLLVTSPKPIGSLNLSGNIRPILRRMSNLPGGLRFTKISTYSHAGDAGFFGSLSIGYDMSRGFSKFCAYQQLAATPGFLVCQAVNQVDRHSAPSCKIRNLRQITIRSQVIFVYPVGEAIPREQEDLDHLLVRL